MDPPDTAGTFLQFSARTFYAGKLLGDERLERWNARPRFISIFVSHDVGLGCFVVCFVLIDPSKEHQNIRCWRLWLIDSSTHGPLAPGWSQASKMKIASRSEVPWVWWRFAYQENDKTNNQTSASCFCCLRSCFPCFLQEGAVIICEIGRTTWFNWGWYRVVYYRVHTWSLPLISDWYYSSLETKTHVSGFWLYFSHPPKKVLI